VAPVPRHLNLVQAGAIGTTALTAIQGIDDALHMKTGETLIIHGAAGGVGTLALQFARLRGVRVLATATDAQGLALVKRLGAEAEVDGRSGDIPAAARAFAAGGVDAVLGLAGGASLELCLDALRPGGRYAFPYGVHPEPGPRPGVSAVRYHAIAGPQEFERLNRAIDDAKLEVPIAAEYSLADAAQAHKRIEEGHVPGKIVLRIR